LDTRSCLRRGRLDSGRILVALFALSLASIAASGEEIAAPAVKVQAVPRRPSGVESDDVAKARIPIALVVVNGSSRELTNLELGVDPDSGFSAAAQPRFPTSIAPFGAFLGDLELAPGSGVAYGRHDVVLTVQYRWRIGAAEYASAQPVTASVELRRLFDEEAKALPGGTASLFYLLLPLFPAFFAYQFVDRLRRGEGPQVPVFRSDYLLPAFGIGLLVNYFFSTRYSRTTVLVAATLAGALWPAARWAWEAWQMRRWGFKTTDELSAYLRKVLLSQRSPHGDLWVTAKGGGESWSGVLLAQPDGRPVLGPRLQVSVESEGAQPAAADRLKDLAAATSKPMSRRQRKQLYDEVTRKKATVALLESVTRGSDQHSSLIAMEELVGFERQKAERKAFVVITN
jgi:hypothetical protein